MMLIGRRKTIAGLGAAAAALALPAPAVLAGDGSRHFKLLLGGTKVGEQRISAKMTNAGLLVEIDIDLLLRILGIPVWRYSMRDRELWHGGKLRSLRSRTNDNGKAHFANAKATRNGLEIDGSKYKGVVKGNPATTTYWSSAFMKRRVWINTQHGRPEDVAASPAGTELFPSVGGETLANVWKTAGKLELKIFFDQADEIIGSQSDVRGRTVSIITTEMGISLSDLWNRSLT